MLKPGSDASSRAAFREDLLRATRASVGIDVRRMLAIRRERKSRKHRPSCLTSTAKRLGDAGTDGLSEICVAIGVSTGGPSALTMLFGALRPPMPPIVVVQHMPLHFTGPLATRLDALAELSVKEAAADDVLRPNQVLIAPAGCHFRLRRGAEVVRVALGEGPPVSGHKPSVDVMMASVAKQFGPRCLGLIMTGMGRDGVDGCAAIRAAGGFVLGQNEATSDVYGMNKAAFVAGHIDRQFALDDAATVVSMEVKRLATLKTAASS